MPTTHKATFFAERRFVVSGKSGSGGGVSRSGGKGDGGGVDEALGEVGGDNGRRVGGRKSFITNASPNNLVV
jgi:hypothetical protein